MKPITRIWLFNKHFSKEHVYVIADTYVNAVVLSKLVFRGKAGTGKCVDGNENLFDVVDYLKELTYGRQGFMRCPQGYKFPAGEYSPTPLATVKSDMVFEWVKTREEKIEDLLAEGDKQDSRDKLSRMSDFCIRNAPH